MAYLRHFLLGQAACLHVLVFDLVLLLLSDVHRLVCVLLLLQPIVFLLQPRNIVVSATRLVDGVHSNGVGVPWELRVQETRSRIYFSLNLDLEIGFLKVLRDRVGWRGDSGLHWRWLVRLDSRALQNPFS